MISASDLDAPSESQERNAEVVSSAQDEPLATIEKEGLTELLSFDITVISDIHSLQVVSMAETDGTIMFISRSSFLMYS